MGSKRSRALLEAINPPMQRKQLDLLGHQMGIIWHYSVADLTSKWLSGAKIAVNETSVCSPVGVGRQVWHCEGNNDHYTLIHRRPEVAGRLSP